MKNIQAIDLVQAVSIEGGDGGSNSTCPGPTNLQNAFWSCAAGAGIGFLVGGPGGAALGCLGGWGIHLYEEHFSCQNNPTP
jgi:hypothetical protein